MFSKKDLIKITLPLIIQQVLSVTIGMVDSMMVSSAGEAAVSGVSLVGTLDTLLIIAFTSLVSGGAVVVSQFIGKGDMGKARDCAKQLIYVTVTVALLLSVSVLVFRVPLLKLLFGKTEADVMSSALSYFLFISMSFPFFAIDSACAAIFRSMGNTVISMAVSLGKNILNIIGNAILIYGFEMGAAGAAIATLFSRVVGAAVLLLLLHNKRNLLYVEKMLSYRPDPAVIKSILHIGIPSGIESGMFQFGKLLTQSLISTMGTASIAANSVANALASYQYMCGSAIGSATVTVVGRCVGAKEKEQAKKYSRIMLGATYVCLWIVVVITFIFSKQLIGLYNLSETAADTANELILFHSVCAAVMWPIGFALPHHFRAASDVKFPLVISTFSMWAFRVALSYVFAPESITLFGVSIPGLGMGVMGVWAAMIVDWIFRSVLYAVRYFGGRWLTVYRQ